MRNIISITKNRVFSAAYIFLFISVVWCGYTNLDDMIPATLLKIMEEGFQLLFIGAAFLAFFRYQRHTRREFWFYFAAAIIFGVSYYKCRSTTMLYLLIFFIISKNIDFEAFGKSSSKFIVFSIIVMAVLALTDCIGMTVKVRNYNDTTRYALGFTHPNLLSILVFEVLCFYLYLKRNENTYKKIVFVSIISAVFYFITNSSTFKYVMIMLIISSTMLVYFNSRTRKLSDKSVRFVFKFLIFVSAVAAAAAVVYLMKHPSILTGGLKTLGSRFRLANSYIKAYGIKLFGSKIAIGTNVTLQNVGTGYFYLDNGYFRVPIQFGILVSAVIVVVAAKYLTILVKNGDWQMVLIFGGMCLYFFAEQKIIHPYCNLFLMHIGYVLYGGGYENADKNSPATT